jgi:hypothetical protein
MRVVSAPPGYALASSRRFLVLVGLACLALIGCAKEGPEVGLVTGKVTRGGKPVSGVTVYFRPEVGRVSQGIADQEGNYKLRYTKTDDGARIGKHKVYVVFHPPAGPEAELARAAGTLKPHPEEKAITDKYGAAPTSPLEREVKAGSNTIDLSLD